MSDRVETSTQSTWIILVRTIRKSVFRMEAGGSPKFPWKPNVHLPCSQTPTGLTPLTFNGLSVLSLSLPKQRLPVKVFTFRGSITQLLYSLCTLRAGISTHYATLGSGCWLDFTVQNWLSAGFLRKVSKNDVLSPFHGLSLAQDN